MHGDDSPQMTLFPGLQAPTDAAASVPRRCHVVTPWRVAVRVLLWLKQPPLAMRLRALERDEDTAFDFPTRAVVSAASAAPVETTAPASIFAMADAMRAAKDLQRRGRFGDAAGFETSAPRVTVVREAGRVKVIGGAYPANRWDEERQEQERQRRARQKPPRPTRKAKTRSQKLLDMIGDGGDE